MTTAIAPTQIQLGRAPANDEELWHVIHALWGVKIPRVQVCPDHVAPFTAVAHAFFAREPGYAVWYASRGSGKSLNLAILGLTKSLVLDVNTTILGGSMTQSQNVAAHMSDYLEFPRAPLYALKGGEKKKAVTATQISLATGKWIRPIPASQTTVRGPHPPLQLLDEVDEMDLAIYDASLGQAMEQKNIHGTVIGEYIVASSTWQNPDGTFTEVIDRARKQGMPIFTWCVATGTQVVTLGGEQAIETLRPGQMVLTRRGWRPVQHVTDMGVKHTITLELENGRRLTLTRDHKVATLMGWQPAGALVPGSLVLAPTRAAAPVPSIWADVDVAGVGHVMPASAGFSADNGLPGDLDVLTGRDGLQMTDVDAHGVPAQMVELDLVRQWPNQPQPDRPVGVGRTTTQVTRYAVVAPGSIGPQNAVTGVDGELGVVDCAALHVVSVTASDDQQVWDIGVDDAHEFVAEGIVVHNCWRELIQTKDNPDGWMSQKFIDRKRKAVSAEMWRTEYELNEPSAASRAFDLDALERSFIQYDTPIDMMISEDDSYWEWAAPLPNGLYAIGADWAKERDKTVFCVIRYDVMPRQLVYLRRMNRKSYKIMVEDFDKVVRRYHATGRHDKTGLGNAVADFSSVVDGGQVAGFDFTDRKKRSEMLLRYIGHVEGDYYRLPRPSKITGASLESDALREFYKGHRATTTEDVYGNYSQTKGHLPDDVSAMALAHMAAGDVPGFVTIQGVSKVNDGFREVTQQFQRGVTGEDSEGFAYSSSVGVVTVDRDIWSDISYGSGTAEELFTDQQVWDPGQE